MRSEFDNFNSERSRSNAAPPRDHVDDVYPSSDKIGTMSMYFIRASSLLNTYEHEIHGEECDDIQQGTS